MTRPTNCAHLYDTDDAAYSDALAVARRNGANHDQSHTFATIYADAWRESFRTGHDLPDPATAWQRVTKGWDPALTLEG